MKHLPLFALFAVFVYLLHTAATKEKQPQPTKYKYVEHLDAAATVNRSGFQLYDSVCICQKGNDTTALVCKKDVTGALYYVTTLERSEAIFRADIGRQIATLEAQERQKKHSDKIREQILNEIEQQIALQCTK